MAHGILRYAAIASMVLLTFNARVVAQDLKIGAVLPLSGKDSEYGDKARRGAEVALEIINARKLFGNRQIRIAYEDGKGMPSDSLSALRRLELHEKIPAFLTQLSSVSLSLAPISNMDGVLQMDVGSTSPAYRKKDAFTFRTAVTSLQLAYGLAEAMTKLGVRSCAVLYQEGEWGNGFRQVFSARYEELGGRIVMTQPFMSQETNFRSQLARFKAAKLPIVLTAGYSISGTIIRQAREIGSNNAFFSDVYAVESPEAIATAGDALEGITYVAPRYAMNETDLGKEFVQRFSAKYGELPVQQSAQAHDGVFAIALAAKECDPAVTAECIRVHMRKLSFAGASGLIEFDEMGDVKARPTILKMYKEGKFVVVDGQ